MSKPPQTTHRVCRHEGCWVAKPVDQFRGSRSTCRECRHEAARARRAANPEVVKARKRRWYDANREVVNARTRQRRAANREVVNARTRQRRAAHPEHARELRKTWEAKHPERNRAKASARRAIKAQCPVGDRKAVAAFYKRVHDAPRLQCYWCRKWVPKAERVVDHIIPLRPLDGQAKGSHAATNLCCSCAACNGSKNNRPPEDVSGQFELGIT